jgi:thiamine-phosphate pyrophosphorylase
VVRGRDSGISKNKKLKTGNIDFRLYLVTDRKQIIDNFSLITAVRQALKSGVKVIQLREKDLNTQELLKVAYKMRDVTEQYGARLFINNSFDVALAAGADGVSTHSLKEARAAERGGADFITFGPVYRTPSKLRYGPPQGLDNLEEVCCKVGIPVFAIGGIKSHRIDKVKKAGAYGVAMISEIFGAENIKGKAEELVQIIMADV